MDPRRRGPRAERPVSFDDRPRLLPAVARASPRSPGVRGGRLRARAQLRSREAALPVGLAGRGGGTAAGLAGRTRGRARRREGDVPAGARARRSRQASRGVLQVDAVHEPARGPSMRLDGWDGPVGVSITASGSGPARYDRMVELAVDAERA